MGNDGIDEGWFKDLENKLNNHLQDYENFKNQIFDILKNLQDQLNDKVDYAWLSDLEKILMDWMNDMIKQLANQFAPKSDTKKALKMLEK